MIGVTVSTNYSEYLNITLPQNYKFFKKWYIITYPDDKKTIDLIKKYNYDCVEILYFNFYLRPVYKEVDSNGLAEISHFEKVSFNKGAAIRYAQSLINEGENVLLLDSDIFIPDTFIEYFSNLNLEYDKLYGVRRVDYHSLEEFKNDKVSFIYGYQGSEAYCMFMGYFQLYKHLNKYCYQDSDSCRDCDNTFCWSCFLYRVPIENLIVKHLGFRDANHFGKTCDDPFFLL
jgi:hypothetical protein